MLHRHNLIVWVHLVVPPADAADIVYSIKSACEYSYFFLMLGLRLSNWSNHFKCTLTKLRIECINKKILQRGAGDTRMQMSCYGERRWERIHVWCPQVVRSWGRTPWSAPPQFWIIHEGITKMGSERNTTLPHWLSFFFSFSSSNPSRNLQQNETPSAVLVQFNMEWECIEFKCTNIYL